LNHKRTELLLIGPLNKKIIMKYFLNLFTCLLITSIGYSQTLTPSDNGSTVNFVIKNFGLKTTGYFKGLKGKILFNPSSLNSSQFSVTVSSSTINTDNGSRDGHLRKTDYFDVAKYPVIVMESTRVIPGTSINQYIFIGNLTIKGITKEIKFNFTASASGDGYIFDGSFDINRLDFSVGSSSLSLSDSLKVTLHIVAIK
jgi:polyisoprenoid-binding protein YceI